jgi:hypothetical protein
MNLNFMRIPLILIDMESLNIGKIETVQINRKVRELTSKVDRHQDYLKKLEKSLVLLSNKIGKLGDKIWNETGYPSIGDSESKPSKEIQKDFWTNIASNPELLKAIKAELVPSTVIKGRKTFNSIDYFWAKVDLLDHRIDVLRSVAKSRFLPTRTGFAVFQESKDALIASQVLIHSRPMKLLMRRAPEPRDIVWHHLDLSWRQRLALKSLVQLVSMALTFLWLIPVALIVSLTSLEQLSDFIPGFGDYVSRSSFLRGFIQDVLPTYLTSFLMGLLPNILYGKMRVIRWKFNFSVDSIGTAKVV